VSIGASEEKINLLGAAYLATIELGVCLEDGKIKAFGAGISGCVSDL
jgi:phenylalanine-4-hydroxylase